MKHSPDFILLSPLSPSLFGYTDEEVQRMVNELQLIGIRTVLVDTGREMVFYARANTKELLEDLCSAYDIGGILVQISAIYDQVVQTELVTA